MQSSVKTIPTSFPTGSLNGISILLSILCSVAVVKALMWGFPKDFGIHIIRCVHVLWSVSSAALLLISLTKGIGWRKLCPLCLKTLVSWKTAKIQPRSTNSSSTSTSPPAHTKHRKVYAICLKTSTSCASIESWVTHSWSLQGKWSETAL